MRATCQFQNMNTALALILALNGGCSRDVQLAEYLRREQPATGTTAGRIPDVDSVLAFIAPDGLMMTDSTEHTVHRYSAASLRTALRRHWATSAAKSPTSHIGRCRMVVRSCASATGTISRSRACAGACTCGSSTM